MQNLMPPINTPDNLFHDGNPLTGEQGTVVTAAHLNSEQEAIRDTQQELISILSAASMEPDSTAGQLLKALNILFTAQNDTIGALASLIGAPNKLPYFTGAKDAKLTNLSQVGRNIIGKDDVESILTYLGLGSIANAADITAGTNNKLIDAFGLNSYFPARGFGTSGYIKIPNQPGGLILQWGQIPPIPAGGSLVVNYGLAFPSNVLATIPIAGSSPASANSLLSGGGGDAKSSFQVFNSLPGVTNTTGTGVYVAIGF